MTGGVSRLAGAAIVLALAAPAASADSPPQPAATLTALIAADELCAVRALLTPPSDAGETEAAERAARLMPEIVSSLSSRWGGAKSLPLAAQKIAAEALGFTVYDESPSADEPGCEPPVAGVPSDEQLEAMEAAGTVKLRAWRELAAAFTRLQSPDGLPAWAAHFAARVDLLRARRAIPALLAQGQVDQALTLYASAAADAQLEQYDARFDPTFAPAVRQALAAAARASGRELNALFLRWAQAHGHAPYDDPAHPGPIRGLVRELLGYQNHTCGPDTGDGAAVSCAGLAAAALRRGQADLAAYFLAGALNITQLRPSRPVKDADPTVRAESPQALPAAEALLPRLALALDDAFWQRALGVERAPPPRPVALTRWDGAEREGYDRLAAIPADAYAFTPCARAFDRYRVCFTLKRDLVLFGLLVPAGKALIYSPFNAYRLGRDRLAVDTEPEPGRSYRLGSLEVREAAYFFDQDELIAHLERPGRIAGLEVASYVHLGPHGVLKEGVTTAAQPFLGYELAAGRTFRATARGALTSAYLAGPKSYDRYTVAGEPAFVHFDERSGCPNDFTLASAAAGLPAGTPVRNLAAPAPGGCEAIPFRSMTPPP